MNISFWYEYGQIKEIGTGHKYRSEALGRNLKKRGHQIFYNENFPNADIIVVDHMFPQTTFIDYWKAKRKKIVLIDGAEKDVPLVDLSISASVNDSAQFKGADYVVFEPNCTNVKYNPQIESDRVFVGLGGYDAGNFLEGVLDVVINLFGLKVIVAESINHTNKMFEIYEESAERHKNYNPYELMRGCFMGITNGGLTLFQALHFGLPTIALPQYLHQEFNIADLADGCCWPTQLDGLEDLIGEMDDKRRLELSAKAERKFDGRGIERVCDLIEGMK